MDFRGGGGKNVERGIVGQGISKSGLQGSGMKLNKSIILFKTPRGIVGNFSKISEQFFTFFSFKNSLTFHHFQGSGFRPFLGFLGDTSV